MIVTLKQKQYNFISDWWEYGIGGRGKLEDIKGSYIQTHEKLSDLYHDLSGMTVRTENDNPRYQEAVSDIGQKLELKYPEKKIGHIYSGIQLNNLMNHNTTDEEIINKVKKLNLTPEEEKELIEDLLDKAWQSRNVINANNYFNQYYNEYSRGNLSSKLRDSNEQLFNKDNNLNDIKKNLGTSRKKIEEGITHKDLKTIVGNHYDNIEEGVSNLIKRRNLTRAGMITTGVGAVGAGGYRLYKHFKNKKENNLNTKL